MALLLTHHTDGLVAKMGLQHRCSMDTPALGIYFIGHKTTLNMRSRPRKKMSKK